MSVKVILEFQTAEGRADDVRKFFRDVLPDTRAYDGFESLVVHQDDDEPTRFLIWEQWATRPQYESYLQWRTDSGAMDQFVAMLSGPPSIRFFNHVGV